MSTSRGGMDEDVPEQMVLEEGRPPSLPSAAGAQPGARASPARALDTSPVQVASHTEATMTGCSPDVPAEGEAACPGMSCSAAAENPLLPFLARGSYRAGTMLEIKSPKETTLKGCLGFSRRDTELTVWRALMAFYDVSWAVVILPVGPPTALPIQGLAVWSSAG